MGRVNHPNIVNMIEYGEGEQHDETFKYILLELANGGSLFDYVAEAGRFEEKYARHFFKQLLEGVAYLHSSGITHRDLKSDNLLLDDDFNLKIADFGFAAPIKGHDGSGILKEKLGTPGYMAPELHLE